VSFKPIWNCLITNALVKKITDSTATLHSSIETAPIVRNRRQLLNVHDKLLSSDDNANAPLPFDSPGSGVLIHLKTHASTTKAIPAVVSDCFSFPGDGSSEIILMYARISVTFLVNSDCPLVAKRGTSSSR